MASVVAAWPTVALGEVVVPISRSEIVQPDKEYRLLGIRLDGNGPFLRETKLGAQLAATTLFRVATGDFIYSRLFAWRGAFGTIGRDLDGCYVSGEFPTFQPVADRLDTEFLRLWFRLPSTLAAVEADCTGSTPLTRNRFKEQFFLALQIPLPPLDEQRRIVARIEALAARIAEAQRLRREATSAIGSIVPSVVDRLMGQIRGDKVRLADILREDSLNGLSHRPTDDSAGTPILRISAGTSRTDGVVDEGDYKRLQVDVATLEKYRLQRGDLVACRFNGNLSNVGRFALYQGYTNKAQVYPDKLIRFRVNMKVANPAYVRIALSSRQSREVIESCCATTAGNIGISAGNLKTVELQLPELNEQARVAEHISVVQGMCETARELHGETSVELDALLPSVLDQAFRGKL